MSGVQVEAAVRNSTTLSRKIPTNIQRTDKPGACAYGCGGFTAVAIGTAAGLTQENRVREANFQRRLITEPTARRTAGKQETPLPGQPWVCLVNTQNCNSGFCWGCEHGGMQDLQDDPYNPDQQTCVAPCCITPYCTGDKYFLESQKQAIKNTQDLEKLKNDDNVAMNDPNSIVASLLSQIPKEKQTQAAAAFRKAQMTREGMGTAQASMGGKSGLTTVFTAGDFSVNLNGRDAGKNRENLNQLDVHGAGDHEVPEICLVCGQTLGPKKHVCPHDVGDAEAQGLLLGAAPGLSGDLQAMAGAASSVPVTPAPSTKAELSVDQQRIAANLVHLGEAKDFVSQQINNKAIAPYRPDASARQKDLKKMCKAIKPLLLDPTNKGHNGASAVVANAAKKIKTGGNAQDIAGDVVDSLGDLICSFAGESFDDAAELVENIWSQT